MIRKDNYFENNDRNKTQKYLFEGDYPKCLPDVLIFVMCKILYCREYSTYPLYFPQ